MTEPRSRRATDQDSERIVDTPKRRRMQLAKAELLMAIAASHAVTDLGKPTYDATGPGGEPIGVPKFEGDICARYGLTLEDIRRLGDNIGQELENRAMRAGYEAAWL